MRIGILHGYELTGSGSNEYTRYLSRALADAGHEVHVYCREPRPESIAHVTRALAWDAQGTRVELFAREGEAACVLHQLPHAAVRPVYLTDKQRQGDVKSFLELTQEELADYDSVSVSALSAVLAEFPVDLVHANHVVWQPSVVAACDVPFIVFPHGSSIEYVVRNDARYLEAARAALDTANGLICGSEEVLGRMREIHPVSARERSAIVGVGVDTSLFAPVPRDGRERSIASIPATAGGKTAVQRDELTTRLDAGDYDAVRAYYDAYDHSEPDVDAADRLRELPWRTGRVLLFVGALTAGKGLQDLLAALPDVLGEHPDTHLVVVGSGAYREVLEAQVHAIETGDQELWAWLRGRGFDLDRSELTGGWENVPEKVPAAPLAQRVHFVGRFDHDRLRHLFPCADLAVFPSVVPEAYPLVLMESLSNGVLPAVSDFAGFADGLRGLEGPLGAELVEHMRLPVGPGRVRGISARICSLLDRPEVLDRTDALRRIAVESFDWSVRAGQMAAAYERFRRAPVRA